MTLRSFLFVPGDSEKKLAKGEGSGADAADLRGCSIIERARRLIQTAAPQHRAALEEACYGISKKL